MTDGENKEIPSFSIKVSLLLENDRRTDQRDLKGVSCQRAVKS